MKNIIYIIIAIMLVSCSQTRYAIVNDLNNPLKNKVVLKNGNKEVVYIPTVSLAKEEYFSKIREFVEKKRKEGYKIYYQSVEDSSFEGLSQENKKKLRKIFGYYPHLFSENKDLPKWYFNYQTSTFENLGITGTDTRITPSVKYIIDQIELKNNQIVLDNCDKQTKLGQKYKCTHLSKKYKIDYQEIEKAFIHQILSTSNDGKIILICDKKYKHFVSHSLKELELVEGSYFPFTAFNIKNK